MEPTLQPSLPGFRNRITAIEAIELAGLGLLVWFLSVIFSLRNPDLRFVDQIVFFILTEGIVLGSWLIYNTYIRIARAGGRVIDIGLWMIASALTGSLTFWTWTILDLNRHFIARLFYRGEAPIEYAWSIPSKRIRKTWEQRQRTEMISFEY
jgi:hypothetical protein